MGNHWSNALGIGQILVPTDKSRSSLKTGAATGLCGAFYRSTVLGCGTVDQATIPSNMCRPAFRPPELEGRRNRRVCDAGGPDPKKRVSKLAAEQARRVPSLCLRPGGWRQQISRVFALKRFEGNRCYRNSFGVCIASLVKGARGPVSDHPPSQDLTPLPSENR